MLPLMSNEEEEESSTGMEPGNSFVPDPTTTPIGKGSPTFSPISTPGRDRHARASVMAAHRKSIVGMALDLPSPAQSKALAASKNQTNMFYVPNIPQGDNIMKIFLSVVLLSFVHCGLIEVRAISGRIRRAAL